MFFFCGNAPKAKNIVWGVNFSQKYCEELGLDWKEVYKTILGDLQAKNVKIAAHWDILEPADGQFYFADLDWQLRELEKAGGKAIVAIGMKTPRWPECHIPKWAVNLSKKEQQEKILEMLEKTVKKFKDNRTIEMWQAENEPFFYFEPFFSFGKCPWHDDEFLKKETELIKKLDPTRQIAVSDSGEWSFWRKAAQTGDIVMVTMYRKAWFEAWNSNIDYPLSPVFYYRRALLINKIFRKEVFCGELQAEPWNRDLAQKTPLAEQMESLDLKQFIRNIDYARKTGFSRFYLWGAEWMYWLKEKHNDSSIWQEAQKLFK